MLRPEQGDVGLDLLVGPVPVQEVLHVRPRVGEKDVVDELDRRCRALDVQQDGPKRRVAAQRDRGTYVGPKQTG